MFKSKISLYLAIIFQIKFLLIKLIIAFNLIIIYFIHQK